MAALSFRHPQFSEDAAWLPIWLQQCQGEPFNEYDQELQTHSIQSFKEFALPENIIERKDASVSSAEGEVYNSFHLFLSGEDNSSVSVPSPFEQAMHFNLHLSSASTMPSPTLPHLPVNTSLRDRLEFSDVLSIQYVETSTVPRPKAHQSEVDHNASALHLPHVSSYPNTSDVPNPLVCTPRTKLNNVLSNQEDKISAVLIDQAVPPQTYSPNRSGNSDLQFISNKIISETQDAPDFKDSSPKDAAFNQAIELSIAASEALVIHELVQSWPHSETMSAAAVLEVSLRVKQARSEEFLLCPSDETDSLTDLDESSMADALADVGLLVASPYGEFVCDSLLYQVKETPASANLCRDNDRYHDMENGAQVTCSLDSSEQEKLKDDLVGDIRFVMPPVTFQCKMEKSICKITAEDLKLDNISASDLKQQKFHQENLKCATIKNHYPNSNHAKLNNANGIPKIVAGETSFLSESADVASDQNSFVHKNESITRIASQTSIPFEGLCDQATKESLNSQDICGSSSLSAVDPLCSVVPCSISSQTANSVQHNLFHGTLEYDIEKGFIPISELDTENPQRSSAIKHVHEKVDHLPIINIKPSRAAVDRQITSLKSYSMISPGFDAFLGRGSVYRDGSYPTDCELRIHASGKIMDGIGFSGKRNETAVQQPCTSILKSTISKDNMNYHETSISAVPIIETVDMRKNFDERSNDGNEAQDLQPENWDLPLILNDKQQHCLQTSSENPKGSSALETLIELQHDSKLPTRFSESENSLNPHVPMKKRVRFSEAAVQLQKNKDQPAGSTFGASKRLKPSNLLSDTRTEEVKRCLTNFRSKGNNYSLVFQGIEFLLTGFSSGKVKDIEELVKKYGGTILSHIPSPPARSRGKRFPKSNQQQTPVVLSSKKLQTTKFLYGCAVNAYILNINWLMDSIAAGFVLAPDKYMILSNQSDGMYTRIQKPVCRNRNGHIFAVVGIMFHGKHSFCTRLAEIFKHGGGHVYKTLQCLVRSLESKNNYVGAIITENKFKTSRHLKHCALERKIPMMSASWIIHSLHLGRLLPFTDRNSPTLSTVKLPKIQISMGFSEEI